MAVVDYEPVNEERSFTGSVHVNFAEHDVELQGTLPTTLTFVGNGLRFKFEVAAGAQGGPANLVGRVAQRLDAASCVSNRLIPSNHSDSSFRRVE